VECEDTRLVAGRDGAQFRNLFPKNRQSSAAGRRRTLCHDDARNFQRCLDLRISPATNCSGLVARTATPVSICGFAAFSMSAQGPRLDVVRIRRRGVAVAGRFRAGSVDLTITRHELLSRNASRSHAHTHAQSVVRFPHRNACPESAARSASLLSNCRRARKSPECRPGRP
jgi:hypothetical protein